MTDFEEKVLSMLAEMHEQIDNIQSDQKQMRGQMSILQGDVIKMQSEMSSMYGDVIKSRENIKSMSGTLAVTHKTINTMQEEITDVRHSVATIEVEHGQKLGALFDSAVVSTEILEKVEHLQKTVDKLKFGEEVIKITEKIGYTA
jgi:chromosome segregation ATPase